MSERTWPRDIDGNRYHANNCATNADPADGFDYCTCGLDQRLADEAETNAIFAHPVREVDPPNE